MSIFLGLAMQAAMQSPFSSRPITQARLNAMADACHAPRKWLVLRGQELVFKANPDEDRTKIECVLTKMSAAVDNSNRASIDKAQVPEDQ